MTYVCRSLGSEARGCRMHWLDWSREGELSGNGALMVVLSVLDVVPPHDADFAQVGILFPLESGIVFF